MEYPITKYLPTVFSVCCNSEMMSATLDNITKYYCTKCASSFDSASENPRRPIFLVELSHISSKCCNSNVLVFNKGDYFTKNYYSSGIVEVRNTERSRLHICKDCGNTLLNRKIN